MEEKASSHAAPHLLVRVRLDLLLSLRHAHRGSRQRQPASTSPGSRSCSGRSSRRRAGTPRRSTSIRPRAATWCATSARIAAARGLAFQMPDPFPANGSRRRGLPSLGTSRAGSRRSPRRCSQRSSRTARTSPSEAVLPAILDGLGLDAPRLIARSNDAGHQGGAARGDGAKPRRSASSARRPFVTEDGELFWGDDRLELALAHAKLGLIGLPCSCIVHALFHGGDFVMRISSWRPCSASPRSCGQGLWGRGREEVKVTKTQEAALGLRRPE